MASRTRILDSLPVHPASIVDVDAHRLRLDGLVAHPRLFTVEDLRALPRHDLIDDFSCLEGWTVPRLHWSGVMLQTLFDLARPLPDASWVQVTAGEFSLPLPLADAGRALVALDLDGQPLPVEHGGPARLVLPGGECFTSVKWIAHIEMRSGAGANSAQSIARARLEE